MDNVTDDFALVHFDTALTYDSQRVIPLLHAAKATVKEAWGDDVWLFGSPWSPPGWMKNNKWVPFVSSSSSLAPPLAVSSTASCVRTPRSRAPTRSCAAT